MLVDRDGLAATARRFGKPDRQINDMLAGRKAFGEKVARSMEARYDPTRPPGWLDTLDQVRSGAENIAAIPAHAVRLTPGREVPIIGTTQGGPPDRIWEETGYPVGHGGLYVDVATADANAYGLRVVGDSMSPRIMEGEWIVVEPNTVPQPGDDVVVKTTDGEVMVKQLVAQHGDTVILASINEAFKRITRPTSEIVFIHYVGPRLPARAIKRRIEQDSYCGEDRRRVVTSVTADRRKE